VALSIRIEYILLGPEPDGTPRYGLRAKALRARAGKHSSLRAAPHLPGFRTSLRVGAAGQANQDWRVLDEADHDPARRPLVILNCCNPGCLARLVLDRRPEALAERLGQRLRPPELTGSA
jgi:hypothetical protein